MTKIHLTGAILAGGAGRRMGGQDKGLLDFEGRPLIAWVIEALAPQVDEILIVANRHLEAYAAFGHRVVSDLRPDYPGPLAGFEAALTHAHTPWVLTCPTDVPGLPADYACLMSLAASGSPAVAVVDARWQPVFSLLPRSALPSLTASLDAGQHKVSAWLAGLTPVEVPLAAPLRDADTPAELAQLCRPV